MLKFIGTGDLANVKLGNTSCYYKSENEILLIDIGILNFKTLIESDILKDVNVKENSNGKKVIVVKIEGAQTEYLFDNMIDGTNVVIPATIILNKEFTSYSDNINIKYTNEIGKTQRPQALAIGSVNATIGQTIIVLERIISKNN